MQQGLGIADHHLNLMQAPDGEVFVEDLGSGLGTCVNGHPVARAPLSNGDLVRFGQVELRFELAEVAKPPTPTGFETASGPPTSSVQLLPEADRLFP